MIGIKIKWHFLSIVIFQLNPLKKVFQSFIWQCSIVGRRKGLYDTFVPLQPTSKQTAYWQPCHQQQSNQTFPILIYVLLDDFHSMLLSSLVRSSFCSNIDSKSLNNTYLIHSRSVHLLFPHLKSLVFSRRCYYQILHSMLF